jgi:thiazole/oxazole-forming peptide maturase SagD family component
VVAASGRNVNVTFYPYNSHLVEDVLKPICSEHGGIARSLLVSPVKYSEELVIKSVVAQMPAYHKVLLNPDLEMQYHLSGYGMFYEEALIRLVGETIERYSLMVAQYTLADQIRYASYEEIARDSRVVPFEYLRPFSDADYAKLNCGQYRGLRGLERDDIVGWVKCPSLFDPNSEILIPAQMLFVGYRLSAEHGEVAFCPGFSTGTAAHTSLDKALQNALLEFIEIDALMLHWYTDRTAPAVTIDDLTVARLVPKLLASDSRYEVLALDLRVLEGVDAHVLGSVVINKQNERPLIVLGAQGHLDPVRAFYRSLMEAVAIAFLGIYGPLYLPQEYLASTTGSTFTDLDRNVAFFASPEDAAEKRSVIHKLVGGRRVLSTLKSHASGDAGRDTARLVRQLSSVSEYGVYLDVTPPETRSRGWKVMRVFLPELVTMCVPGVPYSQHPRFKVYGGIRNEYPHPLP